MLHNRFNPLRSQHEDAPPANPGTATPAPDAAPEKDAAGNEKNEDEPDPDPQPAIDPAAPSEAAAPGKLNAFQRGALRALSMGDLIARVERAESGEAVALAEVARLKTESTRLSDELNKLKIETPAQIEAAEKVREKDVSTAMRNELGKIGISAVEAPGHMTAKDAEKTMSRNEFSALSVKDRGAFMNSGGKLTD